VLVLVLAFPGCPGWVANAVDSVASATVSSWLSGVQELL